MGPGAKTRSKYLASWAENTDALRKSGRIRSASPNQPFVPQPFAFCLVVPVKDESPGFLKGFDRALATATGPVLIVVVVNANEKDPLEVFRNNEHLIAHLTSDGGDQSLPSLGPDSGHRLLIVDLNDPRSLFPPKKVSAGREKWGPISP